MKKELVKTELVKAELIHIGNRLKKLRGLLDLSVLDLAKITGISKGTINSIENGNGFTGEYLIVISHPFGMTLSELSSMKPFPSVHILKERLTSYCEENNIEENNLSRKTVVLKSLIELELINSDFLKTKPRSVKEIIKYLESEYGLQYKSSILSQALINAYKSGLLNRKLEGRIYYYKTKMVKSGPKR